MHFPGIFFGLALVTLPIAAQSPALSGDAPPVRKSTVGGKNLIEFGWDEPDTDFLRRHIEAMEQTPFDGCVFHVNAVTLNGTTANFTWQGWGDRAFSQDELKAALDDLKATRFRRFTRNFLRFNTTPAKLDWFDDYSAVAHNARLAGWLARAGGCRGVLFDIEQYEGALFDYRKQRDHDTKSWELYAAQVRRRGREVMQAFQEGFPKVTLFLTFGYSLPWHESRQGRVALADCHYGLLAPFLDGMLQAARGGVRFVDGFELSYGYRNPDNFREAYAAMRRDLLPIVADPDRYRRHFSFGFGLWLDNQWRTAGWNAADVSKNYFSPAAFEGSLRGALEVADDYVWVYSETPRWWSTNGAPVKLPEAYAEALRRARHPRETRH